MLKGLLIGTALTALTLGATMPVQAEESQPGKGVTLRPARATWNTGFFQEALVRRGLEELGYKVKKPKDLQNTIFYKSLTLGDLDYWTNGWFPMHNAQLPKNFYEKAGLYGYVVKAGGLQGYMISKKHADEFNIQSLDDFKRPEVKKAFDKNNDGKADLLGCPPGWACEQTNEHHLKSYDLGEHINILKPSYEAGMASELAAFKNGEPVFFYTWAPNWTIFKMKPGTDVVWINVPEIMPYKSQSEAVERMTVSGVEGAVSDPVKLGFVVSDVQIAANKKFIAENPAAKKFFEIFALPLADINEQNTRMNDGEKSPKDISRHVDQWIAKNQDKWQAWLAEARKAAKQ
ncbi:glycine betaine/L-proline ABC transporter substrate-binding protein ProX [Desulfogranum mediterraneum]|uniref:glycine betaine/L-proline ABC transporter substrate-binding protein ProX n=1 Tax=Desulfogranum mediterraneum TaxID=160661 RepID=UPI000414FFEE|nr:glycine betaine/L-proline ABC transporter substrate-binding protein ProX [Desulfogranum mediterraneum]